MSTVIDFGLTSDFHIFGMDLWVERQKVQCRYVKVNRITFLKRQQPIITSEFNKKDKDMEPFTWKTTL